MTKGQRIREKREALNISQTDLAKRLGISKQTLYKYENDIITNIPSDVIEKMAECLDCSPSFIMGWEKSQTLIEFSKLVEDLNDDQLAHLKSYIKFILSDSEKGE